MQKDKKFVPYPFYWDSAPIDLSFLYENERPAGKHGFLTVVGDKFKFEDGKEARFWGTNLNSGANFPEFEQSRKIALRLAKFGINIVRFHQLDSEWSTPNIFQFTKGKRKDNTLEFDAESMERLDYFIFCLKNQGIYIYLDMLTYRRFLTGDGVDNTASLADAAKPYSVFDRRLIELQKKFCLDIWKHMNPFTGLAYKDDPAIVLTEITNECDLFFDVRPIVQEPYRSRLEAMYRKWADERNIALNNGKIDFTNRDDTMMKFLCDVQENYFTEMAEYIRSIGVRIPITGTNWSINAANRITHRGMDFQDSHRYWYAWQWGECEKKFDNRAMVKDKTTIIPDLVFSSVLDKPFFVSEWDHPWPSEWRAESSMFLAAVGALQGWAGFAIHTYRYSVMEGINITGKEVSSSAIGNVPYREGVFNTFNDPAKFGLFYHAALMFIRGDVKQACKSISIESEQYFLTSDQIPSLNNGIAEKHRIGMKLCGAGASGQESISHDNMDVMPDKGEVTSDTGELYRNYKKGYGWINTEKTKVLYGFAGGKGEIDLGTVKISMNTDFATIALSSLKDEAIEDSDNLFLVTVGRSENTGMKFNDKHDVMLDIGQAPILIEAIEAKIRIKTNVVAMRVIAINAEGFSIGEIPSVYRNGYLEFETGKKFISMYYLIQAL